MIQMVDARPLPPQDDSSLAIVACLHCNTQLGNIVRGQDEPQLLQADFRYRLMDLSPALGALGIRSQLGIDQRVAASQRLGRLGLPGRRHTTMAGGGIRRAEGLVAALPAAVPCRKCPTLNRVVASNMALTSHPDTP